MLVANLTEFEQQIALQGLALDDPSLAVLDETTYEAAAVEPDWVNAAMSPLTVDGAAVTLRLKPYAVAFVDGAIA
jgi:hypothetical protein